MTSYVSTRAASRTPVNTLVRPHVLSDEAGHAWLTHNVEEVGNLEHFLPKLFRESR